MALNDLYKGVFSYSLGGVLMQNVLYFRNKSGSGGAEALTAAMAGDWPAYWQYVTSVEASMIGYYAQRVSSLIGDSFDRPVSVSTPGLIAFPSAPRTSAVVISLRTGVYGRSKRGRLYHGAYPYVHLTLGVLTDAGKAIEEARWQTWHDKYKAGGSNADWEYGVYSKKIGGYNIPYGLSGFQAYTNFIVNRVPGTERGRKS
jgi:hypothetical protein